MADAQQELGAESEFLVAHLLADQDAPQVGGHGRCGQPLGFGQLLLLQPGQEAARDRGRHGLHRGVDRGRRVLDEDDTADVGLVLDERGGDLEDQLRRFESGQVPGRDAPAPGHEEEPRRGDARRLEQLVHFVFEERRPAVVLGRREDPVNGFEVDGHGDLRPQPVSRLRRPSCWLPGSCPRAFRRGCGCIP